MLMRKEDAYFYDQFYSHEQCLNAGNLNLGNNMCNCVGGYQFNVFIVLNYRIHRRGGQVEKNEMGGACSRCGVEERCIRVRKPERKRLLGRPRPRWEDNLKKDLQKVGCGAWVGSIWLRIWTDSEHL